MSKSDNFEIVSGQVLEALPNTMFKIKSDEGQIIMATLKGKMRKNYVRVFPGDRVKVEMTPYDRDRGRIVYKY